MGTLNVAYYKNSSLLKTTALGKKLKFTLASTRDKFPTITASRLGIKAKKKTPLLFVTLASASGKTHTVALRQNRFVNANNATFIAEEWPASFVKPKVGSPVNFTLVAVDLV